MNDKIKNLLKENEGKINSKEDLDKIVEEAQLTKEEQEAIYGSSSFGNGKVGQIMPN